MISPVDSQTKGTAETYRRAFSWYLEWNNCLLVCIPIGAAQVPLNIEDMTFRDSLSLFFLASLPWMVLFPIWRALQIPSDYTFFERLLYCPVYCLGRLLWRVEIVGTQKISDFHRGGAVIVANHRCSLDPFFLQLAAGRRVHWMVAGEYFKNPIFGPVLNLFQAIPTNRSGADNASMKRAIRLASDGKLVGMFPEGRINRTRKPLLNIRPGAAMVASKSGASLLPCWIDGAPIGWAVWSGLFMSAHVRVFIGQPMAVESEELSQLSPDELIALSMRQVLDLGGHLRFPVELARHRVRIPTS
jgi:1-acyl-sn-glycerol-3-phosphate acyltransferase